VYRLFIYGPDAADHAVKDLGTRVDKAIDTLKGLPKPAATIPPATPPADTPLRTPATPERKPTLDLGPGVAWFTQGQYARAAETFRALTREHPRDARVWYYAALATGLATNRWAGEVKELVNAGLDREKAGSPGTAEIDAAFSGLTQATGREWLSFYRQRASK
jgi:hypothetical protein